MAKEYLSQKKIPYQERDVSIDHDTAREMVEKTKQMGVPVIIVDDKEIIIGFNPARLQEKLGPELK